MVALNGPDGQNGFDATTIEPSKPLEPLPNGDYTCVLTGSELKKSGKGDDMLSLELQVIDGEHKGRKLFDNLMRSHSNPQVVHIANEKLSALCHATGVLRPQDSTELHNLPITVTVKCKRRQDNGDWSNEVAGYKARDQRGASQPAAQTQSAPWQ